MSDEKIKLLTEHYQNTFEFTNDMWKQRNKIFLVLLFTISFASIFSFKSSGGQYLIIDLIIRLLDVQDKDRIIELRNNFPYDIIKLVFMFAIFYMMVNLYHRAYNVLTYYKYLGNLESEIRTVLGLTETQVSFTREGNFYWGNRSKPLNFVKFFYTGILFILLTWFFWLRVSEDYTSKNYLLFIVSLVVYLVTVFFWGAYALSSYSLDKK